MPDIFNVVIFAGDKSEIDAGIDKTVQQFLPCLPFALIGGLWLLFLLGYNLSIASAIGFIALAGVSAEFGVVMLIYLDHAIAKRRAANHFNTETDLIEAIEEGAVLRVRPKSHDGYRNYRWPPADHVRRRHGLRGHAPNCSSHGRRNDHRANALDAGAISGLFATTACGQRTQIA